MLAVHLDGSKVLVVGSYHGVDGDVTRCGYYLGAADFDARAGEKVTAFHTDHPATGSGRGQLEVEFKQC